MVLVVTRQVCVPGISVAHRHDWPDLFELIHKLRIYFLIKRTQESFDQIASPVTSCRRVRMRCANMTAFPGDVGCFRDCDVHPACDQTHIDDDYG